MARWKLMVPHYVNVPGETWEYSENDRTTGRPKRVSFSVPRLLDPRDPTCWNSVWGNRDNQDGEITVCYEGRGESKDYVISGDPTPDMQPLDEEAIAISASFAAKWQFSPEAGSGDYNQSLIDKFQEQQAERKAAAPAIEGMAELLSTMTALLKTNQDMLAAQAPARRI